MSVINLLCQDIWLHLPWYVLHLYVLRDFLGGPVVKNPLYNAGDAGSILGQGTKIPHATGQLSPRTTNTEFAHLNERAGMLQTTEPTRSGTHVPQPASHN